MRWSWKVVPSRITSYNVCYTKLLRMAGPALANLLYGIAIPEGRLPLTFVVDEGQIPLYYNYENTCRPAPENNPTSLKTIPVEAVQYSLGNRITSYNVCYTKLLRPMDRRRFDQRFSTFFAHRSEWELLETQRHGSYRRWFVYPPQKPSDRLYLAGYFG